MSQNSFFLKNISLPLPWCSPSLSKKGSCWIFYVHLKKERILCDMFCVPALSWCWLYCLALLAPEISYLIFLLDVRKNVDVSKCSCSFPPSAISLCLQYFWVLLFHIDIFRIIISFQLDWFSTALFWYLVISFPSKSIPACLELKLTKIQLPLHPKCLD